MRRVCRMPEEVSFPAAELSLDLAAPRGVLVADSCGGLVSPALFPGNAGRLRSHCRLAVADLAVAGGHFPELPRPAGGEAGAPVAGPPLPPGPGGLHPGFLAPRPRPAEAGGPGPGELRRAGGPGG